MFKSQLFARLRSEGLRPTEGKLRYAILLGRIDRPQVNAIGLYDYDEHHLEQLRHYLQNPSPRGRRPGGGTDAV